MLCFERSWNSSNEINIYLSLCSSLTWNRCIGGSFSYQNQFHFINPHPFYQWHFFVCLFLFVCCVSITKSSIFVLRLFYTNTYIPLCTPMNLSVSQKSFFFIKQQLFIQNRMYTFLFQFRLSFYLFSHFVFKLLNPFISYIGNHLTVRLLWFFPYSLFLYVLYLWNGFII